MLGDLRDIQKGLIQRERFDQFSHIAINGEDLAGDLFVFGHLTANHGEVRAALECLGHRHGRVDTKFTGGIVAGGNHPALLDAAANGNRYIPQRGVIAHFHCCIKAVTVAVNDFAHRLAFQL